ncbi:MAG: 30S ribosome-binding factor RbfA [Firmicutes bacterium]|nr:30S ribosome-binding factor RbfA [Bacillota bacterium]MCL2256364.1 30S ribosome-binding factor RbfA [Bacillota bacterium]
MNKRVGRLGSEMRKSLSHIISSRMSDPRVSAMVSVMAVDVAEDLRTAKAYVGVFGTLEEKESMLSVLRASGSFIKRELAKDFSRLKFVPEVSFHLDTTMENATKIDSILEEIKAEENQ